MQPITFSFVPTLEDHLAARRITERGNAFSWWTGKLAMLLLIANMAFLTFNPNTDHSILLKVIGSVLCLYGVLHLFSLFDFHRWLSIRRFKRWHGDGHRVKMTISDEGVTVVAGPRSKTYSWMRFEDGQHNDHLIVLLRGRARFIYFPKDAVKEEDFPTVWERLKAEFRFRGDTHEQYRIG